MSKLLVVFDVSNMAFRAFHVLRDLSYEGVDTGVCFGVFRDIVMARDRFSATHFAFAFDRGIPRRTHLDSRYKKPRRKAIEQDEEVANARRRVRRQIKRMYCELLPAVGFSNCYSQYGYEADDFMARAAEAFAGDVVLVSTDQDLFQLLAPRISIFNPIKKEIVTDKSFTEKYGVSPSQWADVKALAGCNSDNVIGVQGVGEKTAIKFLTGKLQKGAVFERIIQSHEVWEANLKLVQLPFKGTKEVAVCEDNVTPRKWRQVMGMLGITQLESW